MKMFALNFPRLVLIPLLILSVVASCTTVQKSQVASPPAKKLRTVSRPAIARPQGLAILQGLTNANSTQISVIAPMDKIFRFEFTNLNEPNRPVEVSEIQRSIPESIVGVKQFLLRGLSPNGSYRLIVYNDSGIEIDSRRFRTLDITKRQVRFAAASCMSDYFLEHQSSMWTALRETQVDFLLLLGDNNYAAVVNGTNQSPLPLPVLWERYAESALQFDLYHIRDLIPTVAIWDDFDYGMRDGGASNPYGRDAKVAFTSFFAQNESSDFPEYKKGPGIAASWKSFGFNFMLLDNRTYRTAQTHFGEAQETWIFEILKASNDSVWLASGDQWFGGYHRFESYEGNQNASFQEFLKGIKASKAHVLFLSGDRHLSEIMKIEPELLGYQAYEVTSSPMHAAVYPPNWDTIPNRRQWKAIAQNLNFNVFDVKPLPANPKERTLKVRAVGIKGQMFYEAEIPLTK